MKAVEHRIKVNQFNWLNLADLNDKFKIWSLYGIRESAGMTVLLNEQGKIVAIDPSVEELETYLSKL